MKVVNVHQRLLYASPEQVGALIDSLSSPEDVLWPNDTWPRMKFDRPLGVGATGGHGPIGYFVEAYVPGESIRFRFTEPKGFNGWHACEILDATAWHCILEHRIEMKLEGRALLLWPLVIGPLHDACLEDLLSRAQALLGNEPKVVPWSPWVRFLRWWHTRGVTGSLRPSAPRGFHAFDTRAGQDRPSGRTDHDRRETDRRVHSRIAGAGVPGRGRGAGAPGVGTSHPRQHGRGG